MSSPGGGLFREGKRSIFQTVFLQIFIMRIVYSEYIRKRRMEVQVCAFVCYLQLHSLGCS